MKRGILILIAGLGLAGCGQIALPGFGGSKPKSVEAPEQLRPVARPAGVAPPANARTPEQFDTTTVAERAAAVDAASASPGGRDLGLTIASLGSVTEPGIWMKTPLVSGPSKGRVEYPAKGTSVVVDLIPLEGDRGAGSQLSLAAMRLLEAGLTDLPEVRVFRTGG